MSTWPTALIVGTGPGLGLSLARRFGREGYAVAMVARRQPVLAELAAQLEYPILAINCYRKDDGDLYFAPWRIVESGGLRVGIIGIACPIVDKTMPPAFDAAASELRTRSTGVIRAWADDSFIRRAFDCHRAAIRDLLLGGVLESSGLLDRPSLEEALCTDIAYSGSIVYRLLDLAEAENWARSWA